MIFGGRSAEHDVSLRSAETVMAALQSAGHIVVPIGVTREGRWLTSGDPMLELQASSPLFSIADGNRGTPGKVIDNVEELALEGIRSSQISAVPDSSWSGELDVIFPVLHGPMGEDGTVQGLFELAGIPFVGSGVMASSVAMDKSMANQILAQHQIPQARWSTIRRRDWIQNHELIVDRIEEDFGYPCFIKPANLGSSVGISKAHCHQELLAGMEEAARHDRKIVVEECIEGRELEVSVLGNDSPIASVVGEVIPGHEFYDYEAKYVDDSSDLKIPADIPTGISDRIRELAIQSYLALDCAGMARVDFFLTEPDQQILLNEINTIPGFTSISMYPMLWEATGVPLPELVNRLIELALERHDERHS